MADHNSPPVAGDETRDEGAMLKVVCQHCQRVTRVPGFYAERCLSGCAALRRAESELREALTYAIGVLRSGVKSPPAEARGEAKDETPEMTKHREALNAERLAALRPAPETPQGCELCGDTKRITVYCDGTRANDKYAPCPKCTAPETAAPVAWGVTQTITGDDGNCLEAAIATVTGIPLDEFPPELLGHPETHPKWFSRLRDWLYFHDWTMEESHGEPPNGLHVAVGPSPRKAGSHAVVALNGHLIFDPHPTRTFFGGADVKYWIALDRRVSHPLPPLAAVPEAETANAAPASGEQRADVLENLEAARASLVGCFCVCERCGEETDTSDFDAVFFIDKALAVLRARQGETK